MVRYLNIIMQAKPIFISLVCNSGIPKIQTKNQGYKLDLMIDNISLNKTKYENSIATNMSIQSILILIILVISLSRKQKRKAIRTKIFCQNPTWLKKSCKVF